MSDDNLDELIKLAQAAPSTKKNKKVDNVTEFVLALGLDQGDKKVDLRATRFGYQRWSSDPVPMPEFDKKFRKFFHRYRDKEHKYYYFLLNMSTGEIHRKINELLGL